MTGRLLSVALGHWNETKPITFTDAEKLHSFVHQLLDSAPPNLSPHAFFVLPNFTFPRQSYSPSHLLRLPSGLYRQASPKVSAFHVLFVLFYVEELYCRIYCLLLVLFCVATFGTCQ